MHKTFDLDKIHAYKLPHDCDLLDELNNFCSINDINSGLITVIGAAKEVKLSFYEQGNFQYKDIHNPHFADVKDWEIVSATGNVSMKDGRPFVHMHVIVANKDGECLGGHLMKGTTVFSGEAIIQSFKGEPIGRTFDPTTKLSLWS